MYRGQYGHAQILVKELVVGDMIDIEQGDRVPADCILTEEMNIQVDESLYDVKTPVVKNCSTTEIYGFDGATDNHV